MKVLTTELIDKNIGVIDEFSDNDVQVIIEELNQNQPALFAFLMAVTELYSEDIKEEFFFTGFTIMHIMSTNGEEKISVPIEDIDNFEDDNFLLLSQLEGKDEEGVRTILSEICGKYNQRYLLEYVIDELFAEEENGGLFFELEEIGIMLAYLKTIIDCLDA